MREDQDATVKWTTSALLVHQDRRGSTESPALKDTPVSTASPAKTLRTSLPNQTSLVASTAHKDNKEHQGR